MILVVVGFNKQLWFYEYECGSNLKKIKFLLVNFWINNIHVYFGKKKELFSKIIYYNFDT